MSADDGKHVIEKFESQLSVREKLDLQESELRRVIASNVMTTFCWINGAVFLFIIIAYISDVIFIANGILNSNDRSIDAKVIISIVAATTIQLGAIAFSLSQWLFPKDERQQHR